MPSQQTIEAVSLKLKKAKQLEEELTKTVSARVNELHEECFRAMTTDSDNMSSMVTFRLDCLLEFLQNLLIKVQDASGQLDSSEDMCRSLVGIKSISSLVERLDRLESIVEAKGDATQADKIGELQAKVDELTKATEHQQQGDNSTINLLQTELNSLKQKVNVMDGERKSMEIHMKQEVDRIDREKKSMEVHLKQEVDRIDREKKSMEVHLKQEFDRIDKKRQALKAQVKKIVPKQKKLSQLHIEAEQATKILTKKVCNLEVLRDSLSQLTQSACSGPTTVKMIQDTQSQVASLKESFESSDFTMNGISRPQVGFTAQLQKDRKLRAGTDINMLLAVTTNDGNCFKPQSGHFVAPHDGLYGFCVKVEIDGEARYTVCLMSKDAGCQAKEEMQIDKDNDSPHSAVCVLKLPKDRHVYLRLTYTNQETVTLYRLLTFSGWSIGYD